MLQQLEKVADQPEALNDVETPASNPMPSVQLDLVSAVLAAAERSEGLDSSLTTRRVGSIGEVYFIECSSRS